MGQAGGRWDAEGMKGTGKKSGRKRREQRGGGRRRQWKGSATGAALTPVEFSSAPIPSYGRILLFPTGCLLEDVLVQLHAGLGLGRAGAVPTRSDCN